MKFYRFAAVFGLTFICATRLASPVLAETRHPLPGGTSFSNFGVGNFDGNPDNGPEIVAATSSGTLRAFRSDASTLWEAKTPNARCGPAGNRLHSSPAVADLNGDGIDDVVVGYGGIATSGCDGGVVAFDGTNGKRLWNLGLRGFAQKQRFGARWHTVFSTPAIADVDGDGKPEIAFGSFDRNVYLLNSNGQVRWFYNAADTIWSSPAFADTDGDGKLELIAATDISGNKRLKPITTDGGYLYAFKTDNRDKKRVFFRDKSLYLWQTHVDQVPYSSPVIADVIAGNPGAEVIIASGCFFPQRSRIKRGNWIKIFSLRTGKTLRTIRTLDCSSGSVAVGDILGNGRKQIVHLSPARMGSSQLMAFDPETGATIWSAVPRAQGKNNRTAGSFQSPIIADVNKDGKQEVVLAHRQSLLFFAGESGQSLPCDGTACKEGELVVGRDLSRVTPGVVDLSGDGELDLLINVSGKDAAVVSWQLSGEVFAAPPGEEPDARQGAEPEWPMWRGGPDRSGTVD